MTTTLEPKGKLDAGPAAAEAAAGPVNGPEGDLPGSWQSVDWRRAEESVRRLRQRIFTASRAKDLKKVRNLQKLMLRSRANALVSVRRVTEVNAGRATAGRRRQDGGADACQGRSGAVGAAVPAVDAPARQAGVHPEGQREAAPAGDTGRSRTGPCRPWSSMRWSPSGKHGSSRSRMASGRAGAAMTPSRRSSLSPRGHPRRGGGCWTPTWRRHSTGSTIPSCSASLAGSPPGA